jgi:hypothetical protein
MNSEENSPRQFVLTEDLLRAIMGSLSELPMKQVALLMEAITEVPSLEEVLEEGSKPDIFVPH